MNRKYWIVLIIAIALLTLGIVLYFSLRTVWYHSEKIDPRTLHTSPAHHEKLVGLWQCKNHVFYRFNSDGTGITWDINDDIGEKEANPFEWEAFDKAILLKHQLRISGYVPRYYFLDLLNAFDLRFHDSYSTFVLEKVEKCDTVVPLR